jgi:CrcB protein
MDAGGVCVEADSRGSPQHVATGDFDDLPVDPDIESGAELESDGDEEPVRRRSRLPRLQPAVIVAVFVGGFFGGLARYGVGLAAPTPANQFPATTFAINLSGAFALALLLVLVLEVLPPSRFLRPALGTGFLGAYTTFSSLATSTDQLAAHGHAGAAVAYAVTSLFGGLACASFGLVTGRAVSANRHRQRPRGSEDE